MIGREWKKIWNNKLMILIIIAIIAIPTIYSTLFLGSMWDPYGKVDNLPVAVVNNDVAVAYKGTELDIGNKLVDNLKENDSLAFNFVDEQVAFEGLENGTYYMTITIPEDFSANGSTVMDETPKKMELIYATNPGTNYIASKMSETAIDKIKDSIQTEITKTYVETVFDQFSEIGDGMNTASDGAKQLQDGLLNFQDGINSYTEGVDKVADGTNELASNNTALNDGIDKLSSGVAELQSGSKQLVDGLNTMSSSLGDTMPKASDIKALLDGMDNYYAGVKTLNDQVSNLSLSGGTDSIKTSLINVGTNAGAAGNEVKSIAGALATFKTDNLTKEQLLALQTIMTSTQNIGGYLTSIGTDTQSVATSFTQLAASMSKLDDLKTGVAALASNGEVIFGKGSTAIEGLYGGFTSVKDNLDAKIIPGQTSLYNGIDQVKVAIDKESGLKDSVASYTQAVDDINEGLTTLSSNSSAIVQGVIDLSEGTETLATSLKDGADEITAVTASEETKDMFAAPIKLVGSQVTKMENNGNAMSVYMMSVALWVGTIAFALIYPLTEYEGELKSGISWFVSKATVLFTVSIAQALIMVFMLNKINGLHPVQMGKTVLIACLASIAFMSIMYFFNALLGKVGSFLMLIYMVIQLSGSAGTYPVELSGDFVAKIHKYLPFSYTVEAFRKTISGGGSITSAIVVLLGILVVFVVLTIILFQIRTKRIKAGKKTLYDFLVSKGIA